MPKQLTVTNDLFDKLKALARPFEDEEDVIRRLIEDGSPKAVLTGFPDPTAPRSTVKSSVIRVPRERGAVVTLDGETIVAETVPDLIGKVMSFVEKRGLWARVESLAPYKTSSKRYLFAKTPKHPNGNDFFVELEHRNLFFEGHKNYKTTITQLSRFLSKLGVELVYKGS